MYVARVKLYYSPDDASAVATIQGSYSTRENAVEALKPLTEHLTHAVRMAGLTYDEVEARVLRAE
jgi:hypothetical protein